MEDFTKQPLLETNLTNASPSLLKTDINLWNIRFAFALSVFASIAGQIGNGEALIFLLVFLLIGMPIIIKKYGIITFTEDEKFLDINKKEIDLEKLPHTFITIIALAAILYILVVVIHLDPSINCCILVFSFFFIPTFLCNRNNLPVFIIFHPQFRIESNVSGSSSDSSSSSDALRKRTSPVYSYLPQNIYHKP